MIVSAIVAVGPDGEIGRAGALPWPHLQKDLAWFVGKTRGKPVIMGRRTWDSLPERFRPLPDRRNIVLSRDPDFAADDVPGDVFVTRLPDLALTVAAKPRAPGLATAEEAVVIGGRQVYDLFWPYLDRIYLTKVDWSGIGGECDTFFPYPLSPREWREEPAHDRFFVDRPSGIRMGFYTFHRIR